jgi:hypothetical protein
VKRLDNSRQNESILGKVYQAAFDQIDIASLVFFRIVFGAMIASWGWD